MTSHASILGWNEMMAKMTRPSLPFEILWIKDKLSYSAARSARACDDLNGRWAELGDRVDQLAAAVDAVDEDCGWFWSTPCCAPVETQTRRDHSRAQITRWIAALEAFSDFSVSLSGRG
jgi:hypothetical protein